MSRRRRIDNGDAEASAEAATRRPSVRRAEIRGASDKTTLHRFRDQLVNDERQEIVDQELGAFRSEKIVRRLNDENLNIITGSNGGRPPREPSE